MPPVQLYCRNLLAGDILLKVSDGSFTSRAIQFGQTVVGGANPGVIHAGVLFDPVYIIEAQAFLKGSEYARSQGIVANDLRVKNLPYGYHVYRCRNKSMAAGAGTCAKMMFDIHQHRGNLGYSAVGAVGSLFGGGRPATPGAMDALLDRILTGSSHGFFCSQFVVYVYQFVAEQSGVNASGLFNIADAKVPPTTLASALANHSMFVEAGYLMPGER